jgi:hypothetical protein
MNYGTIQYDGRTLWINNPEKCIFRMTVDLSNPVAVPYYHPVGSTDALPMFTPDGEIAMVELKGFVEDYPRKDAESTEFRTQYNKLLMAALIDAMDTNNWTPMDMSIIFSVYAFPRENPCRSPIKDLYAFNKE